MHAFPCRWLRWRRAERLRGLRHWISLLIGYPCEDPSHCGGSTRYVNWRTGEVLTVEDDTDSDYDLDRRRLSPSSPPDSLQSTDVTGRLVSEYVSPLQDPRVVLERRGERRTIGRCSSYCASLALRGSRAAWISGGSGVLHVRGLRSARSWQRLIAGGLFTARVWGVGDELIVAVWPGDNGPVPLYRVALGGNRPRV
jgi:hypothetical protein